MSAADARTIEQAAYLFDQIAARLDIVARWLPETDDTEASEDERALAVMIHSVGRLAERASLAFSSGPHAEVASQWIANQIAVRKQLQELVGDEGRVS